MITYVNNSNAGQYRVLYEKATRDLMAHNELNQLITPEDLLDSSDPSKKPLIEPIPVTAEELAQGDTVYEPNKYYRWDDEKKRYITAEESTPVEGVTYYKANDITSLNQYFGYIADLANINPLYTVLPLDEDVFTVDLNTRKIEIPQHFKENGVSVQGDEIAEVLYFKVNRYFDAQDLAYYINGDDSYEATNEERDKMRIYIQWRSAQSGEDGKLIEGISVPWVVDITTYPDYILFGWPISSKVTGKDGTIDFAIRFFKTQDRKITYSLSTLTHSVTVKPSLDFDISEKIKDILDGTNNSSLVLDDNTDVIVGRLANSEVTDEGVAAGKPYFFVVSNDGPEGPLVTKVDSTVGDGTGIIDGGIQTSEGLVEEFWLAKDDETGILDKNTIFKVSGSGDGRISYSWRKLNIDNKTLENVSYTNRFFETTDTEAQPGKTYYISSGENAWSLAPTPVNFDKEDLDYKPLYEYYSVATIDGVGYYYVTIKNRVQNSLAQKESIEMVVARPLPPQNNTQVIDSGLLKASAEYDLLLQTDAESLDKGVLTYQWYYSKNGGGVLNAIPIEGATESTYLVDGTADADENGAVGDGYYYVIITNNMNKETASIEGNENGTRITHEATAPIVDIADNYLISYRLDNFPNTVDGLRIKFEIPATAGENRQTDDSYSYQWYIYQPGSQDQDAVDKDREASMRHDYHFDNDILIEGATSELFTPNLGGYFYYCEVTNTYNGSVAKGCSPFFYVSN